MPDMPRHSACKLCRDRKVRCDGNQPTCDRCRRSFETCVYGPFYKPTKAELVQTIEDLRDRLDTAESTSMKQSQPFQINNDNRMSSFAPDSSMGIECPNSSQLFDARFPPSFVNSRDPFLPSNHTSPFHAQSVVPFGENLESDFMNYLPSPHMPECNGAALHCQLEGLVPPGDPSGNSAQSFNGQSNEYRPVPTTTVPSLREIRALSSPRLSTSPTVEADNGEGEKDEDNRKIVSELKKYAVAIFAIHADIAGISSAVAEYLAWIRKTPTRMVEEISKSDDTGVLGSLERRVLELHEMAKTRHQMAWREMVGVLENVNGLDSQLRGLESEAQKHMQDAKQFFEASYDISATLPEQVASAQI